MPGQLSVQGALEADELMSVVRMSFLEDRSIFRGQKAAIVGNQSSRQMLDVSMIGSLAEKADRLGAHGPVFDSGFKTRESGIEQTDRVDDRPAHVDARPLRAGTLVAAGRPEKALLARDSSIPAWQLLCVWIDRPAELRFDSGQAKATRSSE